MREKQNQDRKQFEAFIKAAVWEMPAGSADWEIYNRCREHGIQALAAPILKDTSMPDDLRKRWERDIHQQIFRYARYAHLLSQLPVAVPYVILKGISAARYYSSPEYRGVGDIDIMTPREDMQAACDALLENGYRETAPNYRHREFVKDGFIVEVHISFAYVDDTNQARKIDNLILENIEKSHAHTLPDPVNGLVLLEHINHHLESGLGLRQMIDWMMFVHRCLPDEKWPEFRKLAEQVGLQSLAVHAARMCELYLGLPEHSWSKAADEKVCEYLMEYVLTSGNFGRQIAYEDRRAVERGEWLHHPAALLKELQRRGEEEWKKADHPLARPFAWAWEGIRLASGNDGLAKGLQELKRRDMMFEALGVKRNKNGMVVYQNGEYIKKQGMFE